MISYLSFLVFASLCSFSFSSGAVSWGYSGVDGPESWANLSSDFDLCATGKNQSPINIANSVSSILFDLEFNYGTVPLKILNNGHTIQVNYSTTDRSEEKIIDLGGQEFLMPSATSFNSDLSVSGEKYKLIQVHFHSPSEHEFFGRSYPMEAHLVHAKDTGQISVVAVFFIEGETNRFINKLWSNMPSVNEGVQLRNDVQINVEDLLPEQRNYSHYRGSLTTPPCSEGVRWFVLQTPVEASVSQISKFLSVVGENARPIQPLNARFLLENE